MSNENDWVDEKPEHSNDSEWVDETPKESSVWDFGTPNGDSASEMVVAKLNNGLTFGQTPEIMGTGAGLYAAGKEAVSGNFDVDQLMNKFITKHDDVYSQEMDYQTQLNDKFPIAAPITSFAGSMLGLKGINKVAPSVGKIITEPFGAAKKGAGALARIGKGILNNAPVGAVMGFTQPTQKPGVNLDERLDNAKTGGIIGTVLPTAIEGIPALGGVAWDKTAKMFPNFAAKTKAGWEGLYYSKIKPMAEELNDMVVGFFADDNGAIPAIRKQKLGELKTSVDQTESTIAQLNSENEAIDKEIEKIGNYEKELGLGELANQKTAVQTAQRNKLLDDQRYIQEQIKRHQQEYIEKVKQLHEGIEAEHTAIMDAHNQKATFAENDARAAADIEYDNKIAELNASKAGKNQEYVNSVDAEIKQLQETHDHQVNEYRYNQDKQKIDLTAKEPDRIAKKAFNTINNVELGLKDGFNKAEATAKKWNIKYDTLNSTSSLFNKLADIGNSESLTGDAKIQFQQWFEGLQKDLSKHFDLENNTIRPENMKPFLTGFASNGKRSKPAFDNIREIAQKQNFPHGVTEALDDFAKDLRTDQYETLLNLGLKDSKYIPLAEEFNRLREGWTSLLKLKPLLTSESMTGTKMANPQFASIVKGAGSNIEGLKADVALQDLVESKHPELQAITDDIMSYANSREAFSEAARTKVPDSALGIKNIIDNLGKVRSLEKLKLSPEMDDSTRAVLERLQAQKMLSEQSAIESSKTALQDQVANKNYVSPQVAATRAEYANVPIDAQEKAKQLQELLTLKNVKSYGELPPLSPEIDKKLFNSGAKAKLADTDNAMKALLEQKRKISDPLFQTDETRKAIAEIDQKIYELKTHEIDANNLNSDITPQAAKLADTFSATKDFNNEELDVMQKKLEGLTPEINDLYDKFIYGSKKGITNEDLQAEIKSLLEEGDPTRNLGGKGTKVNVLKNLLNKVDAELKANPNSYNNMQLKQVRDTIPKMLDMLNIVSENNKVNVGMTNATPRGTVPIGLAGGYLGYGGAFVAGRVKNFVKSMPMLNKLKTMNGSEKQKAYIMTLLQQAAFRKRLEEQGISQEEFTTEILNKD